MKTRREGRVDRHGVTITQALCCKKARREGRVDRPAKCNDCVAGGKGGGVSWALILEFQHRLVMLLVSVSSLSGVRVMWQVINRSP